MLNLLSEPQIQVVVNVIQNNQQHTTITISLEQKNEAAQETLGALAALKEGLLDSLSDNDLSEEEVETAFQDARNSLSKIKQTDNPETLKDSTKMNGLKSLVERLSDKGGNLGTAVKGIGDGIDQV